MSCFDTGSSEQRGTSYTPEQAKWLGKSLDVYGPQLGKGANVYQGPRVAPTTKSQKDIFDFAEGGGFVTSPESTEKYFQNVIRAPTMKGLREDVIPGVKEAYSGPGYWGTSRAKAEAKATEDTMTDLNTARSNLYWDVGQANKQGALQQLGVGGAQQAQSQDVINAKIQKFAEENAITDPQNLHILMNLLGIGMSTTSGSSTQGGLGAMYFSDLMAGAGATAKGLAGVAT